jgi:hypothetical protein
MNRFALALLTLLPIQMAAQKLYLYPTDAVAPAGSYQTVTAIVTGVNDKTVTWSATGGLVVGTNPCNVNEPCTIALHSLEPGTYRLEAVSNADHKTSEEATITFTPSPEPVTSHPRLIVTQAMLPALRAKAKDDNVVYRSLRDRAEQAAVRDNAIWSWSCNGGSGQPKSDQTQTGRQDDAYLFAFMSMIDPNDSKYKWGCYGRDVWTYYASYFIDPVAPGYSPETLGSRKADANNGMTGNRGSDSAQALTLTPDWLMAGGYLTKADQAVTRAYFAHAAQGIVALPYTGMRAKVGSYNSPIQIDSHSTQDLTDQRAMGNNYTHTKILYLTAAALTFNDNADDDPPLPNTCHATRYVVCPDGTAGSLHAYWTYLAGGMLYKDWAHMEDPTVTWRAYQAAFKNISGPLQCTYADGSRHLCLGDGRGGESSEGSWYQYSLYRLRYALNMIHTAGYDDPIRYGPQMSLGTSSWWDLKYVFDISFLTGFGPNGNPASPAYNYLTTGDSLNYVRSPSDFATEAAMLTADSYVGRKDRTNALRWLILDTAFGGAQGKNGNCGTYCGFDSELSNDFASVLAVDVYITSPGKDPVNPLPSDPRPSLPADLYNGSYNQHAILRTANSDDRSLFSIYCPNTLIDHEHEFCGRFDIFSNGEYITKGRTEFNNYDDLMSSSTQSNTLSIANAVSIPNSEASECRESCFMYIALKNGGQFWHGQQQGFNLITHSELPTYAGFLLNDTPAYNGWFAWHQPYNIPTYDDVTKASRSLVYLRKSNQVIFYDRASTKHAGSKLVSQIVTGTPIVSGNEATWLTRSGRQRAYFTSLLPDHATVAKKDLILTGSTQKADWEPAGSIQVSATDASAQQFLSVLEWGRSSLHKSETSLVESTSGQTFDGAKVGSSLVMFMRDWPSAFSGVTYSASGATTQYVSDLQPDMPYQIAGDGAPASAHSDSAGVLTFQSAGTGSIRISPSK